MSRKRCSFSLFFIVLFVLLSVSIITSSSLVKKTNTSNDDGWYYLSAYPNYSPQGLPDFDQKQDHWKAKGKWLVIGGLWAFCAPSSVADILWWFDSKHENQSGYPGDGVDSYPLVRDMHAAGAPTPGPMSDDHNFNNVNSNQTTWKNGRGDKELIETVAWYCNTNFCRFYFFQGIAGTFATFLENGTRQWIKDAGLENNYTVERIWSPSFQTIVDHIRHNDGVVLNLLLYNPRGIFIQKFLGHYVAVAGINANGSIALSDPYQNKANPTPTPTDHNNAGVVSYDIYPIQYDSPFPNESSWWIQQYFTVGNYSFGGLPHYAMIISEKS
jgi:hypothetical protein